MAFRKLTQQQLEMLSEEDRKIYEQAYEEYCERERFVEKLEQLDNVKMPEVQIKKRPVRRVSSPALRPVQMKKYVADAKGVDLLNVTDNVRRSASNPVSVNPDEKFTAKTPVIHTRSPKNVNVNLGPEYKVGNINKVSVASPSAAKFEAKEYKVDVPEQRVQNEPDIHEITIEDYTVADMDAAMLAALSATPSVPDSKIARNEEPQYQVNVVKPAEADAPDAPHVAIEEFAVSNIPYTSVDPNAVGAALNVAASVNAEPQYAVNVAPVASISGPETKKVEIENYTVAGIPEALAAAASADPSVSAVADKMSTGYKVDIAAPSEVEAPSVRTAEITPLEKINISPVATVEPDTVNPVVKEYEVQGYTPAVVDAPSITVAEMHQVSVNPIDVPIPETMNNTPVSEIRDFAVSVTAPSAITAPDIQMKNTVSVNVAVPDSVRVLNNATEMPEGFLKTDFEPQKVNVSVPEVKIPAFSVPGELHLGVSESQENKSSVMDMEFAAPGEITFKAPGLQVTHASVPAIESPAIDSEAVLNNILATIR